MNETEKQIVAWLRGKVDEFNEKASARFGRNFEHYAPLATYYKMVADAIERGDHRQHSPATVKDS